MATPRNKRWTLPTLMRQLAIWVDDTYDEDLFDPETTARNKTFGVVLDDFISTDLRERVAQIPGQTRIKTAPDGEVSIKENKTDSDTADPKSD